MNWDQKGAETFENGRARAAVWAPAPGVLLTRIAGHADLAMTRFYVARAQRELLTQKRLQVFHDWAEVTGYDPEARDAIRAFGTTNDDSRVRVRYLVRSKILSMAIQTAGLVLRRDFQATSDRAVFERWIAEALRAARGG